jgi:hypothetical protein
MRRLLWVTLLLLACKARFSAEVPRPYACSEAPDEACPGGWVCNLAAHLCIDPDAGVAVACRSDADCGGGWRCGPSQVCVDRSVEGAVTSAPEATSTLLTPHFLTLRPEAPVVSQEAVVSVSSGGYRLGADVLFARADGGAPLWVGFGAQAMPTGETYFGLTIPTMNAAAVHLPTTQPMGEQSVHALWSVQPSGATSLALPLLDDGGYADVALDAPSTRLSPLATTGLWWESRLEGAVITWGLDGGGVLRLPLQSGGNAYGSVVAGAMTLAPAAADVRFAALNLDGGEVLLRGGLEGLSWGPLSGSLQATPVGPVAELQVFDVAGTPVVGWREADGGALHWGGFVDGAFAVGSRTPVPCENDAGVVTLAAWWLVPGSPVSVAGLCRGQRGLERFLDGAHSPVSGDRMLSAGSTTRWGFTERGAIVREDPSGDTLFTLPRAPDALMKLDDLGLPGVTISLGDDYFEPSPLGLTRGLHVPSSNSMLAADDGHYRVTRLGLVIRGRAAVGSPSVDWVLPASPVLLTTLARPASTDVVVVTHDDELDVAVLKADGGLAELTPRLRPSPGFPVTQVMLQPTTDGGLAEGYLIAGSDLFRVTASSPTRWQATREALPNQPLTVWLDGAHSRTVLVDGAVFGLTARVTLTPPTPAPAVSALAPCGAPWVLTDDGLVRWADGGWSDVPLAGVEQADFAQGRLLELDGGLYVFDSRGMAWSVPACSP